MELMKVISVTTSCSSETCKGEPDGKVCIENGEVCPHLLLFLERMRTETPEEIEKAAKAKRIKKYDEVATLGECP